MSCPYCGHSEIETHEVHDTAGQLFSVDRCSNCGGFWFDTYELFQISPQEAMQLDKVPPGPRPPTVGSVKCPRDNNFLQELRDPNVPERIEIFRCPVCSGFWLRAGDLLAYKQYQAKRAAFVREEVKSLPVRTQTMVGLVWLALTIVGMIGFLANYKGQLDLIAAGEKPRFPAIMPFDLVLLAIFVLIFALATYLILFRRTAGQLFGWVILFLSSLSLIYYIIVAITI